MAFRVILQIPAWLRFEAVQSRQLAILASLLRGVCGLRWWCRLCGFSLARVRLFDSAMQRGEWILAVSDNLFPSDPLDPMSRRGSPVVGRGAFPFVPVVQTGHRSYRTPENCLVDGILLLHSPVGSDRTRPRRTVEVDMSMWTCDTCERPTHQAKDRRSSHPHQSES